MKILQFACDGYNSDNEVQVIDVGRIPDRYISRKIVTPWFEQKAELVSLQMWSRIYTGVELDVHKNRYRESTGDTSRLNNYEFIDPSTFIWDILGSKNVSQFIVPYSGNWSKLFINDSKVVTDQSHADMLSGYFGNPTSKTVATYDNGKIVKFTGDHRYTTFVQLFGRAANTYGYDKLNGLWDQLSGKDDITFIADELYEPFVESYNFYEPQLKYHTEGVVNHLKSVDMANNQYLLVTNLESDIVYHFLLGYPDLIERYTNHLTSYLLDLIEISDPDIIFLHGDHGQKAIDSDQFVIDSEGTKRPAIKSHGICPFYTKHLNSVGGYILGKRQEDIDYFIDNYYTPDGSRKLMDNIRDYVINAFPDKE